MKSKMIGYYFALLAFLGLSSYTSAATPVTSPQDIGIDVGTFVTDAATTLGVTVATVVAVYFGFLIVKKALIWARSKMAG